jgi:branched-chain amino acid transport system permease protein
VDVYLLGILVTITIFAVIAVSLDLLIGYTGLFTIAQAAMFGAGAYASGLVSLKLGWGFWGGAAIAIVVGALIASVVAIPSLRVSGDYLVLASFGVQVVFHGLYLNLDSVTGGPAGMRGIPRPGLFGHPVSSTLDYLLLYVAIAAGVLMIVRRLLASPFGLLLKALSEDELVPQAFGKDVVRLKIKVFVLSGALAGLAGSLYAHYITFISPETFDVHASIFVLTMVLVGGMGTPWGPVVGAAILIAIPELLRFLPFSGTELGPLRQIVYGLILITVCFVRPLGVMGRR